MRSKSNPLPKFISYSNPNWRRKIQILPDSYLKRTNDCIYRYFKFNFNLSYSIILVFFRISLPFPSDYSWAMDLSQSKVVQASIYSFLSYKANCSNCFVKTFFFCFIGASFFMKMWHSFSWSLTREYSSLPNSSCFKLS